MNIATFVTRGKNVSTPFLNQVERPPTLTGRSISLTQKVISAINWQRAEDKNKLPSLFDDIQVGDLGYSIFLMESPNFRGKWKTYPFGPIFLDYARI